MPRLTPEETVDKMIRRAGEATEDVVKGIERMTVTPGAMAVKKLDKYKAGVLRSLEDGTTKAGHESYDLATFKERAIPKIRERYASGMAASRDKSLNARIQLHAHQEAIERSLANMPDDTEAQRDARQLFVAREMRKFKLRKSRR